MRPCSSSKPLALSDAVELFTRRATAPRDNPTARQALTAVRDLCRSLDGLPLAIELAAARTRTLSIEEITRRLDDRFTVLSDPTSRKPERRRALRATIRWSYELLFPDDQRGLWALATFAGGAPLPAVEAVLEALDVPAAAAIDVVGRLAGRSLVIVDDQSASLPVRYRLLDSIRAFALEAMATPGCPSAPSPRTPPGSPTRPRSSTQGVRSSRQAEHLAFARAERANIDAALAWSATHDPLLALGIVNGFGWAWVVLGDSRGAQRILAALDAAGDAAPVRDRASALLLAGVDRRVDGSPRTRRRPHRRGGRTCRRDRRCRPASALLLLPRLRRVASRRVPPGDGADRSQSGSLRPAGPAVGSGRELRCSPPEPRSRPATRSAASKLATRSSTGCERSTTRGSRSAATRCSASWPASSTGSTMPSCTSVAPRRHRGVSAFCKRRRTSCPVSAERSARPVTTTPARPHWSSRSTRPKPPVTYAWRRWPGFTSGACCARSDSVERARAALEAATAWHRAAGGGEQAALGECLLAAMDAADARLRRRRTSRRDPRQCPARRRRPGRGLRPRRPRPCRRRSGRRRHGTGPLCGG